MYPKIKTSSSQNPGDFAHQPFSLAAVNGRTFKILSIYVVILRPDIQKHFSSTYLSAVHVTAVKTTYLLRVYTQSSD